LELPGEEAIMNRSLALDEVLEIIDSLPEKERKSIKKAKSPRPFS